MLGFSSLKTASKYVHGGAGTRRAMPVKERWCPLMISASARQLGPGERILGVLTATVFSLRPNLAAFMSSNRRAGSRGLLQACSSTRLPHYVCRHCECQSCARDQLETRSATTGAASVLQLALSFLSLAYVEMSRFATLRTLFYPRL